jgi:hypothetical protein
MRENEIDKEIIRAQNDSKKELKPFVFFLEI